MTKESGHQPTSAIHSSGEGKAPTEVENKISTKRYSFGFSMAFCVDLFSSIAPLCRKALKERNTTNNVETGIKRHEDHQANTQVNRLGQRNNGAATAEQQR